VEARSLIVALAAAVAFVASGTGAAAAGACSRTTATALVNQHRLNGFLVHDPVDQLLCGAFTGPGSSAMAVTIGGAPTCWPIQRWAAFELSGGAWKLVLNESRFIYRLDKVGADIRETAPVFRSSDPICVPSGGKHARTWHWNGTRLVAGAWKRLTPGSPSASPTTEYFTTPSRNIACAYSSRGALLGCRIKSGLKPVPPTHTCTEGDPVYDRIFLGASGRAVVQKCAGDPGIFIGLPARPPVLAYGKTWSGGGLSCTSAFTGLTCRNRSGHGFFLSRDRWRQF